MINTVLNSGRKERGSKCGEDPGRASCLTSGLYPGIPLSVRPRNNRSTAPLSECPSAAWVTNDAKAMRTGGACKFAHRTQRRLLQGLKGTDFRPLHLVQPPRRTVSPHLPDIARLLLNSSRLPAISARAANTDVGAEDVENLDTRKRDQRQPTVTPATQAAIDGTTTSCLCLISAVAIHRQVPRRRADLRPTEGYTTTFVMVTHS
jgi:hypothetical protein